VSRSRIDLVEVLEEYYIQMLQSYAPYLAKAFYPELNEAAKFFSALAAEAKVYAQKARMVLLKGMVRRKTHKDGRVQVNFNAIDLPNDLFAELGFIVPSSVTVQKDAMASSSTGSPAGVEKVQVATETLANRSEKSFGGSL
jgi:hypothetical protein